MAPRKSSSAIHRTMPIRHIVTFCPGAQSVLAEYGLHCFSCAGSEYEALDEGCKSHGFSDEKIDALVDDLNQMLREMPARPQTLTVTAAAAKAVRSLALQEGQKERGLAVIVDASGGFCMEFQGKPERGQKTFHCVEEPSIGFFADTLTLGRIGGAAIDFREGRFKLDLPEERQILGCGCTPESCDCPSKHAQIAE